MATTADQSEDEDIIEIQPGGYITFEHGTNWDMSTPLYMSANVHSLPPHGHLGNIGELWYDSTAKQMYVYGGGGEWHEVGGSKLGIHAKQLDKPSLRKAIIEMFDLKEVNALLRDMLAEPEHLIGGRNRARLLKMQEHLAGVKDEE
jgi:hypothetical protein